MSIMHTCSKFCCKAHLFLISFLPMKCTPTQVSRCKQACFSSKTIVNHWGQYIILHSYFISSLFLYYSPHFVFVGSSANNNFGKHDSVC